MNEAETRAEYIDPALAKAGWGVIEGSRIRREYAITKGRLIGQGNRSKSDIADYLLQYRNRNLAVIEAKSDEKDYTEGVGQAKVYAEKLKIRFTYSTNGKKIYFIDMEEGTEHEVSDYPTPEELWEMTFGKKKAEDKKDESAEWQEKLLAVPYEDKGGYWQLRYYQEIAVTRVIEAVAQNKNRILLTLATGTGKTAIAFQIAWKLFNAKWNLQKDGLRSPRMLFLADRNLLANQAFNSFSAFEEDALVRIKPDEIKKKKKVPQNGSVFFTIFQTFMSGPDKTPYFGEYPKDFFDFIIIDECHRGGANDESSWREIMNYFSPAVQLGLTATPKRKLNADTYKYFGEPVYIYSLKDGINDGFLTPFRVRQIETNQDEYIYTPDDEVLEGEVEEGRIYTTEDQNRIIEIEAVEKFRVETFMKMIDQSQKTLVFCATQEHALAIRNLINQTAKYKNPNYCHRVTANDGKIGEQNLKYFQDNEKTIPTILTTSFKLSTGVDAPEIRNIVLLRPIKTMIEFKQIVGRGTRLFDGKDYFTIYDFVKAYKHFSDPEWDGDPAEETCKKCGKNPCVCSTEPTEPCPKCGKTPCICEYPVDDEPNDGKDVNEPPVKVKIKLSEGKIRELDYMSKTTFWSPEGKPISVQQFLESLFGVFPEFFKKESELRQIWSRPDTRKKLLEELQERGFTKSHLSDFQKMIHAENSDLFDVLAFVAFNSQPVARSERAVKAKIHFDSYNLKQQEFLDFVLSQYVKDGVEQLDDAILGQLLQIKYHALADAKKELGDNKSIRETFIGFQAFLYEEEVMQPIIFVLLKEKSLKLKE